MKLINSVGPNPQVVRMFAAERGIDLPTEDIDLMAGENRQAAHLAKNPAGQSPCLVLDDGSYLSEVTVICEYLDEVNGGSSLIGDTPEARGEARMWTRRVDLNICEPLANGFRFSEGLALFKDRIVTVPEAAEGLKRIAQDRLTSCCVTRSRRTRSTSPPWETWCPTCTGTSSLGFATIGTTPLRSGRPPPDPTRRRGSSTLRHWAGASPSV
jgi:hypothetical protein